MHVLNLPALYDGRWQPLWWAGPVTFTFALPLAYLRERTGGVLAPALLHAWPQGLAFAIRALSQPGIGPL
jgi:membrane protease YdiL (CAAX protease family)